ncbi:hypothetical protein ACFQ3S_02330 [Mucilaginibacter terrae]|uniref:hypothetical protein n=1 Tax=Mucilaginibacter terrae TaxID=1955052 RepID=UPI0036422620
MFTVNNIIIAFFVTGFAGIVFITYILTRQHNKVTDLMQLNKDVPPLFLQRATQHKFNTIRTKLPNVPSVHHEKIKSKLEELAVNFRNETICIKTYNKGLDHLMEQLKKSC